MFDRRKNLVQFETLWHQDVEAVGLLLRCCNYAKLAIIHLRNQVASVFYHELFVLIELDCVLKLPPLNWKSLFTGPPFARPFSRQCRTSRCQEWYSYLRRYPVSGQSNLKVLPYYLYIIFLIFCHSSFKNHSFSSDFLKVKHYECGWATARIPCNIFQILVSFSVG